MRSGDVRSVSPIVGAVTQNVPVETLRATAVRAAMIVLRHPLPSPEHLRLL